MRLTTPYILARGVLRMSSKKPGRLAMAAALTDAPTVQGDAPPLRLRTKLAFAIGSAAETIALFSLGSYALLFYNQVLGLPAWLAGLAISISLVFDGFADPIIGSLSDRTHSRLGRRHPYMFAAPIPIALCFFAIFNPPHGLGQIPLFLWFTTAVIGLRVAMGFFHTPHLALGGELSHSYTERSKVMAWNNFFTWVGGASIAMIALSFFFRATPAYPRGLLNPAPYFPFAVFAAVSTLAILFVSAWFTRDQIPRLPRPPVNMPKFSPFEFLKDLGRVISNRNYMWLLVGLFFLSLMTGVREALNLYVATYFWEFSSEELRWYVVGSFFGFVGALTLTPLMHSLWDKRAVIIWSGIASVIFPAVGVSLRLAGFMFDNDDPLLLPTLVAISAASYCAGAVLNISVMSGLADIADENEVRFGLRQEGVLYATRSLSSKLDAAVGSLLSGLVLTLIAFPQHAHPGAVSQITLDRLAWFVGPITMVPGLIAVAFYARFNITKRHHAATRAQIDSVRKAPSPA
jgi:GPH family glycoside/pentoside/hexuronide:cation symporter